MSEYLKCPLCGKPLVIDPGWSHWCEACGYTGPTSFAHSRRNVIAIQEAQNALIAAALERAKQSALHVPQTPDTGLGAVIGKWPGTEADEEVAEQLRKMS